MVWDFIDGPHGNVIPFGHELPSVGSLGMTVSLNWRLRKLKDKNLIHPTRKAQTIFYSLSPECEKLFFPFFELIENNKIIESV